MTHIRYAGRAAQEENYRCMSGVATAFIVTGAVISSEASLDSTIFFAPETGEGMATVQSFSFLLCIYAITILYLAATRGHWAGLCIHFSYSIWWIWEYMGFAGGKWGHGHSGTIAGAASGGFFAPFIIASVSVRRER